MSAIVLAGGLSRRYGSNKANAQLGGKSLISLILDVMKTLTDDLIVVVADYKQAKIFSLSSSARVIVDKYPNCGSLGGIYSGLSAAKNEWAFVSACDMPFLNRDLIIQMANLRNNYDIVVPMIDDRPEPTHALYRKDCLPKINNNLNLRKLKISLFYDEMKVNKVNTKFIDKVDPERWSFFNINTPEDMIKAKNKYSLIKSE